MKTETGILTHSGPPSRFNPRWRERLKHRIWHWKWRLIDMLIINTPQRIHRVNAPSKIKLYVLMDDKTARPDLDQITFEITAEQWPELERMKGIMVSLEVTGRNRTAQNYQAHFYDAPGKALCRNLSIYACQSFDNARNPSRWRLVWNSIRKSLRSVLVCTGIFLDCLGS
jgi:hypothetical protein